MTANDVKQALQTFAQDAPDTARLHTELVPRIRRRRRIRQAALTATVICGVGAITAGVLMGISMTGPEQIEPAVPVSSKDAKRTFGACGSIISEQSEAGLPLQLVASVPAEPLNPTDDLLLEQIDMSVTNISNTALKVTTAAGAVMAITKDGIVVASPAAMRGKGYGYTIQAGETRRYKSTISLRSCDPNARSRALPAGNYQLHALQTFLVDRGANSATVINVQGGPWAIQIG